MALDGILIHNLVAEMQCAIGTHIDKIFQPSRDELVLLLRGAAFSKRLIISARTGAARMHFTDMQLENPPAPPMFCMLIRKHISGAKITGIKQDGFERVITVLLSAVDEMGDRVNVKLVCELIGSKPNIILVDKDGKIVDAVHRSDIEKNERMIQPGALYLPPEKLGKHPLYEDGIAEKILSYDNIPLSKAILDTVDGISPLVAREIAFSSVGEDKIVSELNSYQTEKVKSALKEISKHIEDGIPTLLVCKDGTPKDFSYIPITQYGDRYASVVTDGFSSLLDAYYKKRESLEHIRRASSDLMKTLNNLFSRAQRKVDLRRRELADCKDKEKLRIYGELIKANIGLIEKGASITRVTNYYDADLTPVNIPLDPALSPASNSAKYFKEYRKKCNAEQTLGSLIEDGIKESEYISSVIDALERAESISEINDIKEELLGTGYLRAKKGKLPKRPPQKPKKYISSDGFTVLVGRNNIQNDELTCKTAQKEDLWLHTKDIHGSHVIIVSNNREVPESTVIEAARLAAFHSKARDSHNVPVDCAKARYVKKPNGAKPGMVIYKNNRTLYVTPEDK